jgi:putative phage-type endonuclease
VAGKPKPRASRYKTNADWHALRAQNIGASEAAALLNIAPYCTYWELWQIKAGRLAAPSLDDNQRVVLGKELEAGIARAAQRLLPLKLRKEPRYLRHPTVDRMGATLDYKLAGRGIIPVEIKLVGNDTFYKDWIETEEGRLPPPHILCQIEHQLAVACAEFGYILALVGGVQLELVKVDRHDGLIRRIEQEVAQFWLTIDAGLEPTPDFNRDYDGLRRLYIELARPSVDARDDIMLMGLISEYAQANAERNRWEDIEKATKARILTNANVRSTSVVFATGAIIKSKVRDGKAGPVRDTRIHLSADIKEAAA